MCWAAYLYEFFEERLQGMLCVPEYQRVMNHTMLARSWAMCVYEQLLKNNSKPFDRTQINWLASMARRNCSAKRFLILQYLPFSAYLLVWGLEPLSICGSLKNASTGCIWIKTLCARTVTRISYDVACCWNLKASKSLACVTCECGMPALH